MPNRTPTDYPFSFTARSERSRQWLDFAGKVRQHIDLYTVPQYGDEGDDLASGYTAKDCVEQAKKYLARFNKNSRPGQELLDLVKAAHYIQMAHDNLAIELAVDAADSEGGEPA